MTGLPRIGARATGAGLAALAAVLLAGCGAGAGETAPSGATGTQPAQRAETAPPAQHGEAASQADAEAGAGGERARRQTVERARCPDGVAGCRSATGRIVYVERVDPDGDGDAHFVIVDPRGGITVRDLTAIDVRRDLRPHPLPGPGDLVSAAGPVQTGSYGQRQIHALVLNVGHR
jgi:hypothetical protein